MSSIKIIIVEDDQTTAAMLKGLLENWGYLVTAIVSSGTQAVKTTLEICPDLVLMDIILGAGIDGVEAAKQIHLSLDIPIVYLTGHADGSLFKRAKITEPYGYIFKPFNQRELQVVIEIALYKHKTEREIKRHRDGLAERVKERTEELSKSNKQLKLEIQERKRAEEVLKEYKQNLENIVEQRTDELRISNAELVRANRLKDEFLANMSHELRTPLTSVLGMSEALIEQVYGPLNEKQIRALQSVESSGKHLLNLINDILDLSKIEAGKTELLIGQVSVEAVCQASLKMVKQIALKKNQKLSVSIDSRMSHIRADMLRLKQMLVNLLMNAVKFTPQDGKIGLEVKGIPEQGLAKFTVWDTGIGISQKNIQKLFEPFVQADGGYTREHEGTGLGLALVYKLAEMHGGNVSVKSETGKYSRFTIVLPWQPNENFVNETLQDSENIADIVPQPSEALTNQTHRAKILMADDNKDNLETVGGYLKAMRYDVLTAYDGAEAVRLTFEKKPDLVLMDIQMPVMDGLEAIKEIRNQEIGLRKKNPKSESKRISIIALTALAMPGDKEKCIEIGADEYISKPAGLKDLARMIEELIDGSG